LRDVRNNGDELGSSLRNGFINLTENYDDKDLVED
jgi:hypothetical protein